MVLAQPIFHPFRTEITLLERGYVLNDQVLPRLAKLNVCFVWIEVDGMRDVQSRMNPSIVEQHAGLCQALDNAIQNIGAKAAIPMSVAQYRRCIEQILIDIVEDPEHEVMTHQLAMCSSRLAGHLANCCYLALLVGAHLSGYLRQQRQFLPTHIAEDTRRLGLGALMHDIGKLQMPEDLQDVNVLDPRSAMPEYQAHVSIGFEQLQGHLPPTAAHLVLNHHQRWDGSGFPARFDRALRAFRPPPQGEAIHIFSRILAVVDVFDHLIGQNGDTVPSIIALAELRSARFAGWFDPEIVDAINRLIPPFLVGSTVTLSDGSEAVVVANRPEAPCKPTVRRVEPGEDESKLRIISGDIDLRTHPDLSIVAADGHDVRDHLYDLPVAVS
jgi:HD-GYP domain-containing protein (c-di-GMP phosphodiesterase class II)